MPGGLRIENGKFYRGDQLVPIEFGNKEQIELMKQEIEFLQELEGEGTYVDLEMDEITVYRASTWITCKCGAVVNWESMDMEEEEDARNELDNESKKCRKCGKEYILIHNKTDQDWRVKLKASNGKTNKG